MPVIQVKNGNSVAAYRSASSAAKLTGTDRSNISKVLRGQRLSAGNYEWKYSSTKLNKSKNNIMAIDNNGEIVAVFKNIDVIKETTNLAVSGINKVLNGERKTSHGLSWVKR